MRSAITAVAIAGLTTGAHAGFSFGTGVVTLTTSASTVNVGDTFTVGVYLSDMDPFLYVSGFDLRVTGTGAAFSTVPGSMVVDPSGSEFVWADGFMGAITNNGAQGSGTTSNILSGSSHPLDDLTVFTFQVEATQGGLITFDAADAGYTEFIDSIAWLDTCGVAVCFYEYEEIIFNSVTVTIIPAPPSTIAIALAFPLATRRRR